MWYHFISDANNIKQSLKNVIIYKFTWSFFFNSSFIFETLSKMLCVHFVNAFNIETIYTNVYIFLQPHYISSYVCMETHGRHYHFWDHRVPYVNSNTSVTFSWIKGGNPGEASEDAWCTRCLDSGDESLQNSV